MAENCKNQKGFSYFIIASAACAVIGSLIVLTKKETEEKDRMKDALDGFLSVVSEKISSR